MRLAIVTAFHGRPEISEVFHLGIRRLQARFDVRLFAAVTEGHVSNAVLCELTDTTYVWHDNVDLGAKHNAAMALARAWEPDAVMVLGSDDLVSGDYAMWVLEQVAAGAEYLYPGAITLYSPAMGMALKLEGPIQHHRTFFGAGRVYSRSLMERMDWKPWSEVGQRKGLDNDSHFRVSFLGGDPPAKVLEDGLPHVLDIKGGGNITDMTLLRGRGTEITLDEAMWFLGVQERAGIDALMKQEANPAVRP